MTTDHPKPRRRWLQFSLRTLLIVVTVFCVWMGITAKRARDQQQAVEAILAAGGVVNYEHQLDRSDPPGPVWLRQLIGDEYFFSVNFVSFHKGEVDDATMAAVSRLTGLTNLLLQGANITDAQLVHLKGLTNLIQLDLSKTQVTDVGMVHLKSMTNLGVLKLISTKITNSGLMHLKGLTNLKDLRLYNTQVTDEGIKKLQQALPNCYITRHLQIARQSP